MANKTTIPAPDKGDAELSNLMFIEGKTNNHPASELLYTNVRSLIESVFRGRPSPNDCHNVLLAVVTQWLQKGPIMDLTPVASMRMILTGAKDGKARDDYKDAISAVLKEDRRRDGMEVYGGNQQSLSLIHI